ncbi:MAG TPA: SDR family NAD(P)-dependent oxidoreductase [Gemmatimonadaceae bacterium]|nr:SDR family NAD(P)-dependent oxidoreductase [Gemmatimonadaceae bacterium]
MSARPIAVVTGASRGIGRAIALRLAERYDIVALARTTEALAELAREIKESRGVCTPVTVDLADTAAVEKALARVDADVLVNNAGLITIKPFLEITPGEWRQLLDVNLTAVYTATRALLPGMMARKRGFIVLIGSLAGRNTFPGGTGYTATKHGVIGFAESLMLEVRDHNVRVATIMPGSVDTHGLPGDGDRSWMLTPEQVADAVWFAVTQPENALISRIEMRPAAPKKR